LYSVWAEGHSGGESERVLGEWMESRGNRADVVIATKVGALRSRPGLSAENAEIALAESLERLRTDHVDLYYFHYDDEDVAIADQVRTAHALVESGRVRHLALSNHSPERTREVLEAATAEGLSLRAALQPPYTMGCRNAAAQGYAPLGRVHGGAVCPYFALAACVPTRKHRSDSGLRRKARESMADG